MDQSQYYRHGKIFCLLTFCAVVLVSASVRCGAKPVNERLARDVVKGWLKAGSRPLGSQFQSSEIIAAKKISVAAGADYYVMYIRQGGLVIVSGDDAVEPIIAFVSGNSEFDPNSHNPLSDMLRVDIPGRMSEARQCESQSPGAMSPNSEQARRIQRAKNQWTRFGTAGQLQLSAPSTGSISDIRVEPLIQSKWWQSDLSSCTGAPDVYNYYTPGNYVCGCVATAMSQFMRFYQYPASGISPDTYSIRVDSGVEYADLRGGDGSCGPYRWDLMPLVPDCTITDPERQAIGALCYDAGVSIHASYTLHLTTATLPAARAALVKVFGYNSAVCGSGMGDMGALMGMMNPNLDASMPVILGVDGEASHAILADGYGYNAGTLYHHLNMGWAGLDDTWYNLPTMDTSRVAFNTITDCIYNIYTAGKGEIISGRVTTAGGAPIGGVNINALAANGNLYTTTTNDKGIYALKRMPSNMSFTISAAKAGCGFTGQTVNTSKSQDSQTSSGNCWGVNFVDNATTTPSIIDVNAATWPGASQTVSLQQDGQAGAAYIILSLPKHGKLFDSSGGLITQANLPYTILHNGSSINYQACRYYVGPDSFCFIFNKNGQSNLGTAGIDVMMPQSGIIFETEFDTGLPADWSIISGGTNSRTWTFYPGIDFYKQYPFFNFMTVNSAAAGPVWMDEQLISGHFNFSGCNNIALGFSHEFAWTAGSDQIGDVDVKVSGGPWQTVLRFQDNIFYGPVIADLSAFADGASDVQIRWHYYNAFDDWYWCIDDVWIQTINMAAPTAGDLDLNCSVDYSDFTRLIAAWLTTPADADWDTGCDISRPRDNKIDFRDMAMLAKNWLAQ